MKEKTSIFQRLLSGEAIPMDDPDYHHIRAAVNDTIERSTRLNNATDLDQIRQCLSELTGRTIHPTTTVFTPFHTNYGRNINLGKNIFINQGCSILDLGGVTIGQGVLIAPNVTISSEGHPVSAKDRRTLVPGPVHIKRNAWIGANATILPGVTVGENAVVAAGAVVNKDVPDNTIVGGVPAKVIKQIED